VIVVTAKDLTAEERSRLNGDVERVLRKAPPSSTSCCEIGRLLPGLSGHEQGKKVGEWNEDPVRRGQR
jgi:hypothetical protein